MKYLLQNKDAAIRTIVALIIAILDMLKVLGFDIPVINEEYILAIVSAFMGFIVWYYNTPTSEENSKHTGMMREEKRQRKGIITGENFLDEGEDVED